MSQIINFFQSGGFSMAELTAGINVIPNQFGTINALGIFSTEGISQRTAIVDYDNLTNSLLVAKPWGAPGDTNKSGLRLSKSFAVPHFPLDDTLKPEDIQSRRGFNTSAADDANRVMQKKLTEMRTKHEQTLEWLRMGVLKGTITDGSGATILNLYTDFGISQASVGFALTTGTTEVITKALTVKRTIELAMTGHSYTGILCICGPGFYDALTTHANVKAAFANWNALQNNYSDYRRGFTYGGIEFREYNGSVPDAAGTPQAMIGIDDAYFVPLGTNLFPTYYAPADFMDTVNTMGLPFYARQELADFGRGVKVHTQCNPLPLCLKPGIIVKGTKV